MCGGWCGIRDSALGWVFWVWVTYPEGDVWESWVITEVLFSSRFCAHPTIEISCDHMVVVAVEILWGMLGGNVEVIIKGGVYY